MEERSFDKEYAESIALYGHPYAELQEFFHNYPKGSVLDLGCGQGRDSIFLASLGYQVTAVDSSQIGIEQMMKHASKIDGIVANILDWEVKEKFDIILFDMVLHSFEKEQQIELIKKYSRNLKGLMFIVFPDDMTSDYFMSLFDSLESDWILSSEMIIKDVPKIEGANTDYTFNMITIKEK